jgi:hypothetical protein
MNIKEVATFYLILGRPSHRYKLLTKHALAETKIQTNHNTMFKINTLKTQRIVKLYLKVIGN